MSKFVFFLSVAVIVFFYGVGVGKYEVFPHRYILQTKQLVDAAIDNFGMLTGTRPTQHLRPVPSNVENSVSGGGETTGYTAVTGFFDDGMEIRLLEGTGDVAHRWPVSFKEIWPNPKHIAASRVPKHDWNTFFNGVIVHPDGSVVFPFFGLIKLDKCGDVVWKVASGIHHSVELSPRGTYWTPGSIKIENGRQYYPVRGDYHEHTVVEVSKDGEILREISILKVLKENGMLGLLSANNRHFEVINEKDIIHLNDVEEIPTEFLAQFPNFSAGDLLLSLREPNLVMVMSPESLVVKWHKMGPWNQQHDADWQPDGNITVFDNNFDRTKFGSALGGSNIMSVDPKTDEVSILYGALDGQHFYTEIQGDQQILENGNILIAESRAGRVLEVTSSGLPVWEFVNRYSDDEVLLISDAVRYPADSMDISSWSCPAR